MYQSANSREMSAGSAPQTVCTAISTTLRAVAVWTARRSQASTVIESSRRAFGAFQGASSGTLRPRASRRLRARSISTSETGLSRGIVPE